MYVCRYLVKAIDMLYYVVYKNKIQDIILDTFTSQEAADRFLRVMKFWFTKPIQIIELTANRRLIKSPPFGA